MQSEWAAKVFGDRGDPRAKLQSLFGGAVPDSGQPPTPALVWAESVIAGDASVNRDVVAVTRLLRRAEPRLTLKSASFLAAHLVKRI
jgi:hypothetical protein